MATAALSLEALPPAGAWHKTLAARAVLAECRANPPKGDWHRQVYALTADEDFRYAGPLAERLHAIRDDMGVAALAYADLTGDFGPMREWCAAPGVDAAIEAVL